MKNWLNDKFNLAILLLIALTAIIYFDSFTSPFFQDDKLLIELASKNSLFTLIPNFPFRPISINIFYSLARLFSSGSPLSYHLILFSFFAGTLFLVFNLAASLLENKHKALLATILYALNVSIFANFYWIATSYFTIGTFFVLLTICLYLRKTKWSLPAAFASFLLALGSYELSFVLPALLILVAWYKKGLGRNLLLFSIASAVLLILRIKLIGLPKNPDYSLEFNTSAIFTLRWYVIRSFNFPEGVDRLKNSLYFLTAALLGIEILFCATRYALARRFNFKIFIFAFGWFLLGALPFFFLPNHQSSYYLGLALFGPAIAVAEIVSPKRSGIVVAILYAVLTIIGLDFLHRSHWIILKNTGPIGKFINF